MARTRSTQAIDEPTPLAPRQFKQRRAAATYEALLQAAATVFARRGFDAAQTPEIASTAGVSTGAFYRYFSDKRQAFVEMMSAHLQKAHDEVIGKLDPERFTGSGIEEAIGVALDVVFAISAVTPSCRGSTSACRCAIPRWRRCGPATRPLAGRRWRR